MKRIFNLMMCVLISFALMAVPVQAEEAASEKNSGTCGEDLTWMLEDGVLTISGEGIMDDYNSYDTLPPWSDISDQISEIVLEEGIERIGAYAFYRLGSISEITIPDSVTEIGRRAFALCSQLTDVTVPDNVLRIEDSAFSGCRGMKSITIGAGTEYIGSEVFSSCNSLADIIVDDGNAFFASADGVLFNKDMTLLIQYPLGNERKKYNIPKGVEEIGDMALNGARKLEELTIPSAVKSIGNDAMNFMTNLVSIQVNAKNKYYTSADGVLFDKDMTCLMTYPSKKSDLSYVIPDGVTSISGRAFDFCDYLAELTLPEGLESIGISAFLSCYDIETLKIPDSVTDIGPMAFMYCDSLKDITLPAGITEIKYCTFDSCASLESLTIPANVESLAWGVFGGCENLKEVIFEGNAPKFVSDTFEDAELTVYYPEGDETWADVIDQDYEGKLTWASYSGTENDEAENTEEEHAHTRWIGMDAIRKAREFFGIDTDKPENTDGGGDAGQTEDAADSDVALAYIDFMKENEDALDGEFEVSMTSASMSIGPNLSLWDVTGDDVPEIFAVCPSRQEGMTDRMSLYMYTYTDGKVREIPREDGESAVPVFWDQTFAHQLTDSLCFVSGDSLYVLSVQVEVEGSYMKAETLLKLAYDEDSARIISEEALKELNINGGFSWYAGGEETDQESFEEMKQDILDNVSAFVLYPGTESAMFYGQAGEVLGLKPGEFVGMDYDFMLKFLEE